GKSSFRKSNNKVFATAAPAIFFDDNDNLNYCLGMLNSKIIEEILPALNPTLNMNSGNISSLPFIKDVGKKNKVNQLVENQIEISRIDWDSREESWDFKKNELIRIKDDQPVDIELEEAFDLYEQYWSNKINEFQQNEEEINKEFIKIY